LLFAFFGGANIHAVITIAHQPIGDSKGQRNRGQAKKLCCVNAAKIKNDKLSSNRQKSDKKHDLRFNDALLPSHDKLQGVIKFQCNEQGQNFAEYRLKNTVIERIENPYKQARNNSIR